MFKSSWLLMTMIVVLMLFNSPHVNARSLAMEAARRQALIDLGYDKDPVLEHEIEVQRRRSELMQQYHPEIYDAEQDYIRKYQRGDEINLIPDSSYGNQNRNTTRTRAIRDGKNVAITYKNAKYIGDVRNGKPEGHGTITFDSGDKYVGEFKGGLFTGKGTMTYANGNKYFGEFRDGKREGQGTLTQKDGVTYVGEFKESKPDGKGTLTSSIGGSYTGEFKAGKLEGNGSYRYLKDEPAITGKWHDNQLVMVDDSDDIKTLRELGYLYGTGITTLIPKDEIKSIEWYMKAANQGDAESQKQLGEKYLVGGDDVLKDYAKAFEWLTKASNKGNSSAQTLLGDMYHDGQGTPKDMAKAAEWYKKAADQGERSAEMSLSRMATSGECENAGVPEHIPGIKGTVVQKNSCK